MTIEQIGKQVEVDRVYIFEDILFGTTASNAFEWCKQGITPQKETFKDVSYDMVPSWKSMLKKEGRIFSTNIKELPEDIRLVLEPQNVKSLLVFPISVYNKFLGFIGFDVYKENKIWDNEEVELLRAISGIITNYYDRNICQKQLRESEMRQKLAIENTQAGLWDWNIKTGDVYLNDFWCNMIGYSKDEIEPNVKSWEEKVHPDDIGEVMNKLNNHFSGQSEFYESIHRLRTKSGNWKWVYDKGKIIEYDENNQPMRAVGTHINIDNQKRIEENLRNVNATKDKLFSIIAHDLRGPIGSMMQIAEMISDKNGLDEVTLSEFMHSQKELAKNTLQLLDNLLNWARFNSEQILYNPKKIGIDNIIDEVFLDLKYKARQKNISLIREHFSGQPVYADEDMVNLIVRNLLSNALKFTENECSIRIDAAQKGRYMEIRISDTGVGISADNIRKILSENEFYSTRGTANEAGTGLGLKLVKNFIAQNKGSLRIESQLNVGTSFIFTLPLCES